MRGSTGDKIQEDKALVTASKIIRVGSAGAGAGEEWRVVMQRVQSSGDGCTAL